MNNVKKELFFSIVIPVFNAEKYLSRCIDSVLRQTYQNFEVFLIDDGSKDQSGEICDRYARQNDRIKVFHKDNGGANSARNIGIDQAGGDYICLIDADDYIEPIYLETIRNVIIQSPVFPDLVLIKAKYVGNELSNIELRPGFYDIQRLSKKVFPIAIERNIDDWSGSLIPHTPWSKIYKNALLKEHCCRDSQIKVCNDVAFVFECVYASKSIFVCDKKIYVHDNTTKQSLQRKYHPALMNNMAILYKYLDNRLIGLDDTIPEQIAAFKAVSFRRSIQKYYSYAPSLLVARKDMKKSIEESGILDMIESTKLPTTYKIRFFLLRRHFYLTCLVMQKIMDKVKGNKLV